MGVIYVKDHPVVDCSKALAVILFYFDDAVLGVLFALFSRETNERLGFVNSECSAGRTQNVLSFARVAVALGKWWLDHRFLVTHGKTFHDEDRFQASPHSQT